MERFLLPGIYSFLSSSTAWINWLTSKDRIWQKWRDVISKIKVIKRLGLLYWGLAFSHPLSEFLTLGKASCHVMRSLYAEVHVIGSETLTVIRHKERKKVNSLSHVQLFLTPSTVAYQAPPSMGFSKQEYWSGLPFPSPGDLPDPGIEPWSPSL